MGADEISSKLGSAVVVEEEALTGSLATIITVGSCVGSELGSIVSGDT